MPSDPPKSSKYHRFNDPGHAHEITFSCFKRQSFLKSSRAKSFLADSINLARVTYQFDVWAWVFMPEHLHLLIYLKLETYSISDIFKAMKQSSARKMIAFLKKRNPDALKYLETGLDRPKYRFWQDGGGYDRNYWTPNLIRRQIEYIHNNPVRRALVKAPEDWEWSSARQWLHDIEGAIPIEKHIPL